MLNVLTLVVAGLSFALSAVVAARQILVMQHANQLPILVELTQEFRSAEFSTAEGFVLKQNSL